MGARIPKSQKVEAKPAVARHDDVAKRGKKVSDSLTCVWESEETMFWTEHDVPVEATTNWCCSCRHSGSGGVPLEKRGESAAYRRTLKIPVGRRIEEDGLELPIYLHNYNGLTRGFLTNICGLRSLLVLRPRFRPLQQQRRWWALRWGLSVLYCIGSYKIRYRRTRLLSPAARPCFGWLPDMQRLIQPAYRIACRANGLSETAAVACPLR